MNVTLAKIAFHHERLPLISHSPRFAALPKLYKNTTLDHLTYQGDVALEDVLITGSVKIAGNLSAKRVHIAGPNCTIGKNLTCTELTTEGDLTVGQHATLINSEIHNKLKTYTLTGKGLLAGSIEADGTIYLEESKIHGPCYSIDSIKAKDSLFSTNVRAHNNDITLERCKVLGDIIAYEGRHITLHHCPHITGEITAHKGQLHITHSGVSGALSALGDIRLNNTWVNGLVKTLDGGVTIHHAIRIGAIHSANGLNLHDVTVLENITASNKTELDHVELYGNLLLPKGNLILSHGTVQNIELQNGSSAIGESLIHGTVKVHGHLNCIRSKCFHLIESYANLSISDCPKLTDITCLMGHLSIERSTVFGTAQAPLHPAKIINSVIHRFVITHLNQPSVMTNATVNGKAYP